MNDLVELISIIIIGALVLLAIAVFIAVLFGAAALGIFGAYALIF